MLNDNPQNLGNSRYSRFENNSWTTKPYSVYACKDITVSGGVTDYSMRGNSDLFSVLTTATQILLTNNGAVPIKLKINSSQADVIPIPAGGAWGFDSFVILDLFVTVSGSDAANFNIITQGWR